MLSQIVFYQILGLPVMAWSGLVTMGCLLTTAYLGMSMFKGKTKLPIMWHVNFARISVGLAILHAVVGLLAFLR